MEKLNELVQQAKEMSQLHGAEWSSALCESGVDDNGKKHHAIISDSKNDFVIDTGSDSNEASWLCDYLELCSPANILAIAEAFRALKQRAEAAEADCARLDRESQNLSDQLGACDRERRAVKAKLAEMEKQEPVGYTYNRGINCEIVAADLNDDCPCGIDLYARPAPAINLAELVPDEMTPKQASRSYGGEVVGYRDGFNACIAAMLRNIEEAE